jgi:hypothetical protein
MATSKSAQALLGIKLTKPDLEECWNRGWELDFPAYSSDPILQAHGVASLRLGQMAKCKPGPLGMPQGGPLAAERMKGAKGWYTAESPSTE